jgi:hypothetical protein
MSDDALERLKKRQRPSVPSRDAALTSSSLDTSTSRYQDILDVKQPELLKTKQSTLRLEAELSDRLSDVCKSNDISREVLIEALFEHYQANPEAWQVILAEAKRRAQYRMQVANIRRAKSMMQRFQELD